MSHETIIVETKGKVGIIRLNRPQALNALNAQVNEEMTAAIDAFEADDTIGCVILTGSEKAFAAGADIKEMSGKSHMDVYKQDFAASWERVARMRKPVIAAVAGFALGGGCELAMMCDIIIAADNAKFGQPEIKLGVIPGIGGTQRLTRAVGKAKAMDLNLTGRMMDAAEAERSRAGRARGAGREPDGRGDEGGRDHRRHVADRRDDREGSRQPRVRDDARRGHPLRAPHLPGAVRHPRSEGRHGGVHREAPAEVRESVDCARSYFRTQITRTTEAFAASVPVTAADAGATFCASSNARTASTGVSAAVVAGAGRRPRPA